MGSLNFPLNYIASWVFNQNLFISKLKERNCQINLFLAQASTCFSMAFLLFLRSWTWIPIFAKLDLDPLLSESLTTLNFPWVECILSRFTNWLNRTWGLSSSPELKIFTRFEPRETLFINFTPEGRLQNRKHF